MFDDTAAPENYYEQSPEPHGVVDQSGDSMIAFAVLSFPKKHNSQTHLLLQNGVKGLLHRAGHETRPAGSYLRDFFSVGLLYVSLKDETPALLALREILEMFGTCFMIARYMGEKSWMLLYPQEGQGDFQNIFYKPSEIESGQAVLADEFQQREMALAWLRNVTRKMQQDQPPLP